MKHRLGLIVAASLTLGAAQGATATRVQLTYLGTAGWEITDGKTVVLIDPFLSRPRIVIPNAETLPTDTRPLFTNNDIAQSDAAVIDAHIQSAAQEWPLQQMARIDKNILRLAIYEILFNNTVPAKAAINEAVELAKSFGSETSSRFINGVLGTIFNRAQQQPIPKTESEVK